MASTSRNCPPDHGIRVLPGALEGFARDLLLACGMDGDGAGLVARLLVASDRRCVFSHGTQALREYLPKLRDGRVNPRPAVRVERQAGATAVIDGDGGLGYHACHLGMRLAIEAAGDHGVGAVTTYNHYHFGAAGTWARMALERDCLGLAISSHRFHPNPQGGVLSAAPGSPISIAVPAGRQPPLVLDMAASMLPHTEELMAQFPQAFFKELGIAAVNVVLGGILAGIYRPEVQAPASKWESNQGSFLTAWDVSRFMDLERFRAEMDRYVGQARQMKPVQGFERAELPGGMEWAWERESLERGIPIGDAHRAALEELASRHGVAAPFADVEGTRF